VRELPATGMNAAATMAIFMISRVSVAEIHLVCHDNNNGTKTRNHFESGFWRIDKKHLRSNVIIALHDHRDQPSYLQGELETSWIVGKKRVLRVKRTRQPLPWKRGGAYEVGYLWEGQDHSDLPLISVTIETTEVGNNKAVKSLLEAETFEYPQAAALNYASNTGESTTRQRDFIKVLAQLAMAQAEQPIPIAFRDQCNAAYRLDDGAIRMAIAAKYVERVVGDSNGQVTQIRATSRLTALPESIDLILENASPGKRESLQELSVREPKLVRRLKKMYANQCQICGSTPFAGKFGDISEAHHIEWLSRGGGDELSNLVLVCPNHHSAIHGRDPNFDWTSLSFRFHDRDVQLRLNRHLTPR
jgi:hypothetical protein